MYSSRFRISILGVLAALTSAAPVLAQVIVPPEPEKYDARVRYRIRTTRDQRITQFEAMANHLKKIGFAHADEQSFLLDLLDPAAETVVGSLPSANVPKLFDDANIKTALFSPSGTNLFDDPAKEVAVRIELVRNLGTSEQRRLHAQATEQLAKLGFQPGSGYDHRGYTRIRGVMPARNVTTLLKDLRGLPTGWFVGEADRETLPFPLRAVLPVREVYVLGEAPKVTAVQPAQFGKLTPDLVANLSDPATANQSLVVEAVLEYETADNLLETRAKLRTAIPGVMVEGFAGAFVTLRLPNKELVKKLVELQDIRHLRLPRAATETAAETKPQPATFVADSRVDQLHALGYNGAGVSVVVVASEFARLETKNETDPTGKVVQRVSLAGTVLPLGSKLFDLTGEINPTLEPKPVDPNRTVAGTAAALSVHAAAPQAPLTLLRVDPSRIHQLITVVRAVVGKEVLSPAMYTRAEEIGVRAATLESRRKAATDEFDRAFADLGDSERAVNRRNAAAATMKAVQADENDHKQRLDRFLALRTGLEALRGAGVVVNTLVWEAGYPHDGQSELSRLIESYYTTGGNLSAIRASKKQAPTPVWVQAGGMANGSVWSGPFIDQDDNGVMEYAGGTTPIPTNRWTRELNFLGRAGSDGKVQPVLVAGTKFRLSIQWREPHALDLALASEPAYPFGLRLFRQLDPDGKQLPSDTLQEVARSSAEVIRLYKSGGSGVYEAILEVTIPADGVYAVRVEREGVWPKAAQLRPRLLAELPDPVQAAQGAVVFDTFAAPQSGVAIPGDSPAAVTIGTTTSQKGVGPGVTLGTKPDLTTDSPVEVNGKSIGGTAVSAGYAGGTAASLLGAGSRPADLIKAAQLKAGGPLELPYEWTQQLRPRVVRER